MPALVAGELDLTATTLNAGLFNTVSKGAPFKLILDRGSEKPGHGSMTIVASNDMYEQGYRSANDGAKLKGKTIAIQAPGSIDQYLLGRAAEKAGLNPKTDLNWSSGMRAPGWTFASVEPARKAGSTAAFDPAQGRRLASHGDRI